MRVRNFLEGVGRGLVFSAVACFFVIVSFLQHGELRLDDVILPFEGVLAFYLLAGVVIGGLGGLFMPFVNSYPRAAVVGFGSMLPIAAIAWAVVGIDNRPGDYIVAVAFIAAALGGGGGCVLYNVKRRHAKD